MLKIKASYGEVGNDDIGSYRYVDTYEISNVDGEVSLGFTAKGNRDISWETVTNLNAGVEFELFDQRLNGTVEVYNKKTTDMLLWFTTPRRSAIRVTTRTSATCAIWASRRCT